MTPSTPPLCLAWSRIASQMTSEQVWCGVGLRFDLRLEVGEGIPTLPSVCMLHKHTHIYKHRCLHTHTDMNRVHTHTYTLIHVPNCRLVHSTLICNTHMQALITPTSPTVGWSVALLSSITDVTCGGGLLPHATYFVGCWDEEKPHAKTTELTITRLQPNARKHSILYLVWSRIGSFAKSRPVKTSRCFFTNFSLYNTENVKFSHCQINVDTHSQV